MDKRRLTLRRETLVQLGSAELGAVGGGGGGDDTTIVWGTTWGLDCYIITLGFWCLTLFCPGDTWICGE